MPAIPVVLFKEDDGTAPLLEWLDRLQPKKAVAKCLVLVELLTQQGPGLRRPHADILRDGIHELRTKRGAVRYRMLYFFHGKPAVLTHGFAKKEAVVPDHEIDRAVARPARFLANPTKHTFTEAETT